MRWRSALCCAIAIPVSNVPCASRNSESGAEVALSKYNLCRNEVLVPLRWPVLPFLQRLFGTLLYCNVSSIASPHRFTTSSL